MSAKHMTKEQLTEIVQAEAAKHGYKEAEACFVGIKDLKVKWNRTLSWISLEFSDYLDTLPPSAIKALVADTFKTIKTGKAGIARHSSAPSAPRSSARPTGTSTCPGAR